MTTENFVVCFISLLIICPLSDTRACAQELPNTIKKTNDRLTKTPWLVSAPEALRNNKIALATEGEQADTPRKAPAASEMTLHGQAEKRVKKYLQRTSDTRNFSSLYEAEVSGNYRFDEEGCKRLASHGVIAEPSEGANAVRFHTGSMLLTCSVPVNIRVRNANVQIAAGSIVFIKANPYVALVMNLHDEHHHSVEVNIGERTYSLAPGRELVLTSMLNLTYDEANMTPGIWFRSVHEDFPTRDSKVFLTQFSTLSTLREIPVVRKVASYRREHGAKIVKTAAAVYAVSHDRHVFRWKLDELEIKKSREISSARIPRAVVSAPAAASTNNTYSCKRPN